MFTVQRPELNTSENVPGGFAGAAHQQNNDASKLGRKQAPPDLFFPKGNTHSCILFAPYNMGTHMLPCPTSYKNAVLGALGGLALSFLRMSVKCLHP